jgi:cytochrome c biogenesis protein CcmG, thiol:disulfide interchange protein DsbE
MKKNILFINFLILFSSCINEKNKKLDAKKVNVEESKEFYKNGTAKLMSKVEYDSSVVQKNRRTQILGMKIIPEIMSEIRNGDSIIYAVDFHIRTMNNKMIGKALPDFTFKDIDGKVVKLADLKGKPIILNLWFVECPPCIAEMPTLNAIKERYADTDIQFLSITYESKEKVKKFLEKTNINYRIIPNIGNYYKFLDSNFPQTIFVNRDGIITDVQNGMTAMYDKKLRKKSEMMEESDFINSLNAIK